MADEIWCGNSFLPPMLALHAGKPSVVKPTGLQISMQNAGCDTSARRPATAAPAASLRRGDYLELIPLYATVY